MKLGKATLYLHGRAVETEIELQAPELPSADPNPLSDPRKRVAARTGSVVFFSTPSHETNGFLERLYLAVTPPWGSA